jgi:hypothetical protein
MLLSAETRIEGALAVCFRLTLRLNQRILPRVLRRTLQSTLVIAVQPLGSV